ncbi:hypothetical protein HOY80DRAFT_19758 [Tuber brumale]|nr:hypothetical protein HOY80DRAFT_19758 [Tuber brumale]
MTTATTTTKTLYRSLLRELPPISQKRTHLHDRLRRSISGRGGGGGDGGILLLEQLATYLCAQRTYTELLERYNPSLGSGGDSDGDRVRMSARRVGLHVPE